MTGDSQRTVAKIKEDASFQTTGENAVLTDFGDARAEYQAARDAAGLFALGFRGQIELTGKDRAKLLHNFCTNDIRGLTPGTGCEAFVTSIQGKVLAHIHVFCAENLLEIECMPASAAGIIAHLSKYQITEDVEFVDRSNERGVLLVSGPEAAAVLGRVGCDVSGFALLHHGSFRIGEVSALVRRTDLLGAPGYEVIAATSNIENVWIILAAAGARQAGASALNALRIEAGTPFYGTDITDANLAQEVHRTERAISFRKGCYLGQEPIARIDALGHVNQELFGIRFEPADVPYPLPRDTELLAGEGDKSAGRITSSARSFADDGTVALAYVRRPFNVAGKIVKARVGDVVHSGTLFWPGA